MLSLGIDIGGTKVAAGVVDRHGQILRRVLRPTPSHSAAEVEDAICSIVADLSRSHRIESVGIGAAGWVDTDQAVVRFSPHLAWRNEPIRDRLSSRIDLPVLIDNDANAAAWAEYRFGAGHSSAVMVCITLGTGIGGAMVMNGKLFRGRYGMAGEFGHMSVVPDGHLCACGNRGCWEQYASGNALVRDAEALIKAGSPASLALIERLPRRGDGALAEVTGPAITDAAVAGDPLARELLADVGTWLGRGLANLSAAIDPDLFVIGGGVSAAGDLLVEPARTALERSLSGRGFRPVATVALAHFRNDAGLIGAADLARHAITEPPGRARGFWPGRRRRSRAQRTRPRAFQERLRELMAEPSSPDRQRTAPG